MASSHTTTFEVAAPPQVVEGAVFQAFVAAGLTGVRGGGGTMHGSVPMTWLTWGHSLTATVGFGPSGALVTVRSESALPTQVIDFGANRKHVERVVAQLRTRVPVV